MICYLRMINEWRNDNSVTELLLPSSVLREVKSILCKNNSMLPPTKRVAESMHVSLILYTYNTLHTTSIHQR